MLLIVPVTAEWSDSERQVAATWDRTSWTITSTAADNETDTIVYHFDAAAASLDIDAHALGGTGHWRLRWTSLVEYQDLDGNGAYNLGDPIAQQLLFKDLKIPTVSVQQSDTAVVSTVTYRHPDTFRTLATLTFRVVSTTPSEGPLQTPTEVRWTLQVHDFPFATDNQTRLAVEQRWGQTFRGSPTGIEDVAGPLTLRHAWDETSTVDDAPSQADITVQSYARDRDGETIVVTTMPRGQFIEHDARAGLQSTPPAMPLGEQILENIEGSWPLYLAGIVGAGLLVGYPLIRRRREA